MTPFEYHINEFAVHSDFPLPFDYKEHLDFSALNAHHITFRRGSLANVPCILRRLRHRLVYDVGDGFLVQLSDIVMHIDLKASTLTIDCADDRLAAASFWAVHAGLGIATLTRGGVSLHGAGLEISGKYVALMADSGTGKSTLSWFLMMRGARFGNDDAIPTYSSEAGVMSYPSISLYPKLSREAVDRHGLNANRLLPASHGTSQEEYYVPLPPLQRVTVPAPLSAVFLLRPVELGSAGPLTLEKMRHLVTVQRLTEDDAAAALRANLHTVWLLGKWTDGRRLDALCCRVAAHVPVYTLAYPRAYALLPQVSRAIHQTLKML